MPTIRFTSQLERFLSCPAAAAAGGTVAEALADVFRSHPPLRDYVLDEHGRLRAHVAVFVDGVPVRDRLRLSDPVGEASDLFVMQALSGG